MRLLERLLPRPTNWAIAMSYAATQSMSGKSMSSSPDQEPSFDPRSWVVPKPAPAAVTPPSPTPALVAARPPATTRGWIAPGIGIAIAVAGAIAAVSSRPSAPPPTVTAPAIVPGKAALESRTLIVPTLADLAPTLAASGVSTADSQAAVRAIGKALGSAPGDIRLAFTLDHDGDAVRLAGLTATLTDGSGVTLAPQTCVGRPVSSAANSTAKASIVPRSRPASATC